MMRRTLDRLILLAASLYVLVRYIPHIWLFRNIVGYIPFVGRPTRYNDKMLWRKVFDHNPRFVTFCDKLSTKQVYATRCPTLLQLNVLWKGTTLKDVPQDLLEHSMWLKANHGWGLNAYLHTGTKREELESIDSDRWLRTQHGLWRLEWGYTGVQPFLFLEESLAKKGCSSLVDLSVHAVNGAPVIIEVETGTATSHSKKGYFHPHGCRWRELERQDRSLLSPSYTLPDCASDAMRHTQVIGLDTDYARYDFLVQENKIYSGEITVYPGSGMNNTHVYKKYNAVINQSWDIRASWFLRNKQKGLREVYRCALNRSLNYHHDI